MREACRSPAGGVRGGNPQREGWRLARSRWGSGETHKSVLGLLEGLQLLRGQRLELGQVAAPSIREVPQGLRACGCSCPGHGHDHSNERQLDLCSGRTESGGSASIKGLWGGAGCGRCCGAHPASFLDSGLPQQLGDSKGQRGCHPGVLTQSCLVPSPGSQLTALWQVGTCSFCLRCDSCLSPMVQLLTWTDWQFRLM